MTLALRYAARSDRGLVRQNNQDSVYAGPRLLALADGMGGHAAGEVASKLVIAAFAPLDDDEPGNDLLDQLHDAIMAGNAAISEQITVDPELEGMGTTLTAVLFGGNKIGLAHVGDSRAYLFRDGVLSQITHDDTFVQSLIDEGRITEEEANHHPQRSLLLKALTGHEVEPSLTVREARAGDRYLLCSDGLSGVVSAETLAEALTIPDPHNCADRLIELALRGGGPDNVTCIVADVIDVDYGEDAPIIGGAAGNGVEDPQPDSAASRAATTTLPRPGPKPASAPGPVPPLVDARRRRSARRRAVLVVVLAFGLLVGMTAAGSAWVLSQYFVGHDRDGEVVIFQGVRGEIFGLPLHTRAEGSCPDDSSPTSSGNSGNPANAAHDTSAAQRCEPVFLADLQPSARVNVERGMVSNGGLAQAREIVEGLRRDHRLPPCPVPGEPAGSDTGGSDTGGPADGLAPGDAALGGPPVTPPGTTPTATAPPAPDQQNPQQNPLFPPVPSPPTGTPLPDRPSEPGVDCRTVR